MRYRFIKGKKGEVSRKSYKRLTLVKIINIKMKMNFTKFK